MGRTVLDLFCGAGGFSLGFEWAGYDVLAGVDVDETALDTFAANHDARAIECDLATVDPETFAHEYDIHPSNVNVIIGGPPCQGFSTAQANRDPDDPRNNLVFRFARYVDHYQPESFVMENVTGITSIDDGETVELLCEDFRQAGYSVEYATLNAADYGVPQKRRRVFFVGQQDGEPAFPEPTHAPSEEIDEPTVTALDDALRTPTALEGAISD
jgi:DNA (cytosine-5)-methyltransferase 1